VAGLLRAKRHQAVVPAGEGDSGGGGGGDAAEVAAAALRRALAAPKDPALLSFLVAALRGNMFFSALGEQALRDVAAAMEPREVAAGAELLRQGDAGDDMFVVQSGRLEALVGEGEGAAAPRRAELGEGCAALLVGELALLFGTPRSATVTALTNARLWRVDRATFRAIVAVDQAAAHEHVKAALRRGVLAELEEAQLARVAAAAHVVRFSGGERIIKKGEPGEVFYIIDSGSVLCTDLPGEQRDNVLTAGDYFGERALLTREARACNVFAEGDVTLVALHREDFEALLGHLHDLMDHNAGMRLLLCCPWLAPLGNEEKVALFRHLRLLAFKPGQVLLAQGTAVSQFFVIKGGVVNVWAAGRSDVWAAGGAGGGAGGPTGELAAKLSRAASSRGAAPQPQPPPPPGLEGAAFLGALGAGQWFGEEEVADFGPSRAYFVAAEAAQVFVLDADSYRLYLAPLMPQGSAGARAGSGASARGVEGGVPAANARPPSAPVKPRVRLGIPFKELELRCVGAPFGARALSAPFPPPPSPAFPFFRYPDRLHRTHPQSPQYHLGHGHVWPCTHRVPPPLAAGVCAEDAAKEPNRRV
jgi:CRP-like cAMP-binding protein